MAGRGPFGEAMPHLGGAPTPIAGELSHTRFEPLSDNPCQGFFIGKGGHRHDIRFRRRRRLQCYPLIKPHKVRTPASNRAAGQVCQDIESTDESLLRACSVLAEK
jgi:hypothetical protein